MTDRELLEAAAKAAGHVLRWNGLLEQFQFFPPHYDTWNPLDSDADAFRLMVDCGLDIDECGNGVRVWIPADMGIESVFEFYGTDKHSATRRAVVRAAAAMGGEQ